MHFANYHDERKVLEGVVEAPASAAIVLVTGPQEFGKTWFLRWFVEAYKAKTRIAQVDLTDPAIEITPLIAMNSCLLDLGQQHFTAYREGAQRPSGNTAIIQNVTVQGDNNSLTASTGTTLADQLAHAIELTESFVAGVTAAAASGEPIVICFDGYSSAQDLTRSWIERALVGQLARAQCALLILTSRGPPCPALLHRAGDVCHIELKGVRDVGEWMRLAKELDLELPGSTPTEAEQRLIGIVDFAGGEPGGIMRWLQGLAERPA